MGVCKGYPLPSDEYFSQTDKYAVHLLFSGSHVNGQGPLYDLFYSIESPPAQYFVCESDTSLWQICVSVHSGGKPLQQQVVGIWRR